VNSGDYEARPSRVIGVQEMDPAVPRLYEARLLDRTGFVRTRMVPKPYPVTLKQVQPVSGTRKLRIETATYAFIGVEVDRTGTWARYEQQ
jgi:hypothetical protein